MEAETKEFLLAEYNALRAEILDVAKEVSKNENPALIVSGAFWSWLAAQVHNAPYLCLFSWLPLALTWLLFHKAKVTRCEIYRLQ